MINNKDLYHFEPDSAKSEMESTSPADSAQSFPVKLLYQTIISLCCLILLLMFSRSGLPGLQWINQRIHYAVNSSMEDTFGRISKMEFLKSLIANAGNLVRLEEITKNISSSESILRGDEKRIFQNSVWPVQGSIIKGYGWQYDSASKLRQFNTGIEITALPNTVVLAIADGTITEIKHQPQIGWELVIRHENGWSSAYHYLGRVNAKIGQKVKAGEPIALIGRPDQEKGSVLLLEIKDYDQPVDPLSVLVS